MKKKDVWRWCETNISSCYTNKLIFICLVCLIYMVCPVCVTMCISLFPFISPQPKCKTHCAIPGQFQCALCREESKDIFDLVLHIHVKHVVTVTLLGSNSVQDSSRVPHGSRGARQSPSPPRRPGPRLGPWTELCRKWWDCSKLPLCLLRPVSAPGLGDLWNVIDRDSRRRKMVKMQQANPDLKEWVFCRASNIVQSELHSFGRCSGRWQDRKRNRSASCTRTAWPWSRLSAGSRGRLCSSRRWLWSPRSAGRTECSSPGANCCPSVRSPNQVFCTIVLSVCRESR